MKKVLVFIVLSLMLVGLVSAADRISDRRSITGSAADTDEDDSDNSGSGSNSNDGDDEDDNSEDGEDEVRERIREETRTRTNANGEQERVRVRVEREVKTENGKTEVTIKRTYTYANGTEVEEELVIITEEENGNIVRRFRFESQSETEDDIEVEVEDDLEVEDAVEGNETVFKARLSNGNSANIDVLPERVRELVRERLRLHNDSNISLKLRERIHNNIPRVVYNVETNENGKFLGIFKIAMRANGEVDAETGEVLEVNRPWWAFLVSVPEEETSEEADDTVTESQICCKITPVVAPDIEVNSTYELRDEADCSEETDQGLIIGVGLEIVDNSFCE